jgi:hypothetical protein
MYDFIFYCLYSQQMKKGKGDNFSRFNGSLITGLTLVIHLGFIIVIARAIFFKTIHYNPWPLLDALPLKTIGFLLAALPFLYYNKKRVQRIREHYNGGYLSFSIPDAIKFIAITLLPLLVIIKLSSK